MKRRTTCTKKLAKVHNDTESFFPRIVRQGKLFQKCTHLLYCGVLSLGGNVNTRRMSKPEMGRTLMHLFLFTNSAQRELVLICTQSIHDRNKLSLPYILGFFHVPEWTFNSEMELYGPRWEICFELIYIYCDYVFCTCCYCVGPVPTVAVKQFNYFLLLAYLFLAVCGLAELSKSAYFRTLTENLRNAWREAEIQHEHAD